MAADPPVAAAMADVAVDYALDYDSDPMEVDEEKKQEEAPPPVSLRTANIRAAELYYQRRGIAFDAGTLTSKTFDNEMAIELARERRWSSRIVDRGIRNADDVSEVQAEWGSIILRVLQYVRTAVRTTADGQNRTISVPIPKGLSFDALADLARRLVQVSGDRSLYLSHGNRTVTLSAANLANFTGELSGTLSQREAGFEGGSNIELMGDLLSDDTNRWLRITVPGAKVSQSGSFFPFLLCIPELFSSEVRESLEDRGLFAGPHVDPMNYKHSCLTIAIAKELYPEQRHQQACETFTKEHSSAFLYIVSHTRSGRYDRDRLGRLAQLLRRHIRLTCLVSNRKLTREYKCDEQGEQVQTLCIGLLNAHFFSLAPIPHMSAYALRNLDAIVGTAFCLNKTSRFTTATEKGIATIDHSYQQVTKRECGVNGAVRWRRTADVSCCPFTFLETLCLMYHDTLLLSVDELAFYEAITLCRERTTKRESVWRRAMIVNKEEFTPVGSSLEELRHEQKITRVLIDEKLPTREAAAQFLRAASERSVRNRRSELGFELPRQQKAVKYGFFDVESRGDSQLPYCCALSWGSEDDAARETLDWRNAEDGKVWIGDRCGEDMLRYIRYSTSCTTSIVLYAHNSNYDIRTLVFRLRLPISFPEKGCIFRGNSSSIISLTCTFKGQTIIFRDTYCHFGAPLRALPASFEVRMRKEIMSHELVNRASLGGLVSVADAMQELQGQDVEAFLQNAREWDCFVYDPEKGVEELDIFKYSSIYCLFDVHVLRLCWSRYRETMRELTHIDVNSVLTITSLAFRFMLEAGSFRGMCLMPLSQRSFIERCLVGGRCTTRVNQGSNEAEKVIVNAGKEQLQDAVPGDVLQGTLDSLTFKERLLDDIDMNSCYPGKFLTFSINIVPAIY